MSEHTERDIRCDAIKLSRNYGFISERAHPTPQKCRHGFLQRTIFLFQRYRILVLF